MFYINVSYLSVDHLSEDVEVFQLTQTVSSLVHFRPSLVYDRSC